MRSSSPISYFPDHEPTAEDVDRIKNRIRERDVLAVFVQPYGGPATEMLRDAGEESGPGLHTLYRPLDDKVTSFIEVIRFNADEIARCLGGETT